MIFPERFYIELMRHGRDIETQIEQSLIKVNYSQRIKDRFKVLVPQLSIF